MLVKRTWPKGRRCRSQAMILQPTCRPEGLSQLHVLLLKIRPKSQSRATSPCIFSVKGVTLVAYFPGSPKTKLRHTPILPTTLRDLFFKELKRLGSIRSEATRNLIDHLTSSSVGAPSSLCKSAGVHWWGLGSPHLKIKKSQWFCKSGFV